MRIAGPRSAILACAIVAQSVGAQQPPKLPAPPPPKQAPAEVYARDSKVVDWQAPQEPLFGKTKSLLAQVPAAGAEQGDPNARRAELALIALQTETIKTLLKRVDDLDSRVRQLEASGRGRGR